MHSQWAAGKQKKTLCLFIGHLLITNAARKLRVSSSPTIKFLFFSSCTVSVDFNCFLHFLVASCI